MTNVYPEPVGIYLLIHMLMIKPEGFKDFCEHLWPP